MSRTIIIAGRIPSKKNNKRAFGGKVVSSKAYLRWESDRLMELINEQLEPIQWERAGCNAFFWMPDDRTADLSNKWESIADLLVTAKYIKDDCWKVLAPIFLYPMGIDRKNPRVVLEFYDSTNFDYARFLPPASTLDYARVG